MNSKRSSNGKADIPEPNPAAAGLKKEMMPKHIAMIVDGNRRWSVQQGYSEMHGYNAGRKTLMPLLRLCSNLQIKVASFFVFSTENWSRPTKEVDFLMKVVEDLLRIDGDELNRYALKRVQLKK
ncbi:hypothetical protein E3N88_11145 [Mikania micrantha]|uniref:Alkyl transferase n=1 Tax=Mikania micrantha TaxID=192012 RepID=A0A5N6PEL4_9ASTR|nr:hypothetical protein E3N88_11145 [Mikania micrantha]